jgi:hypothetical protein
MTPPILLPSTDAAHKKLIARTRAQVLADVQAGRSLDDVDDLLEGVRGLGREEQAALWLYAWASSDR